jgi:putative glutathione S-transferase
MLQGYGSFECDEACIPDTVNGCANIREVYEIAGDTEKLYTTPLLWDKKEKTIVSNESMDILRMFNDKFNDFAANPTAAAVDLFPAAELEEAEALNSYIYPAVNNGVYRCGFAKSQDAYDKALHECFGSLERPNID